MALTVDHSLDGQSRAGQVAIAVIVGCVVTTLVIGLRTYTRCVLLGGFQIDDWTMVAAQVFSLATAVTIGLGMSQPAGPPNSINERDCSRLIGNRDKIWSRIA